MHEQTQHLLLLPTWIYNPIMKAKAQNDTGHQSKK